MNVKKFCMLILCSIILDLRLLNITHARDATRIPHADYEDVADTVVASSHLPSIADINTTQKTPNIDSGFSGMIFQLGWVLLLILCIYLIWRTAKGSRSIISNKVGHSTSSDFSKLAEYIKEISSNYKKADFMNIVSHELRTPIHGLTNLVNVFTKRYHKLSDQVRARYLENIKSSTARLQHLANNLFDFTNFITNTFVLHTQQLDFIEMTQTVIQEVRENFSHIPTDDLIFNNLVLDNRKINSLFVIGDRIKLEHIVRNLLMNACKLNSPGKGKIEVSISYTSNDQQTILLEIICTKINISPSVLKQMLILPELEKPLREMQDCFKLRLIVAKQIAKAHKGTIDIIYDDDMHEARFGLKIPVHLDPPLKQEGILQNTDNDNAESGELSANRKTVLIIDDEEICLSTAEMILYSSNIDLIKAQSGAEGLSILSDREKAQNINIILLDLMMPEIDGIEVLRKIKSSKELKHIPVILQTGTLDETQIKEALSLGAAGYLRKPYQKEELMRKINDVCMNSQV